MGFCELGYKFAIKKAHKPRAIWYGGAEAFSIFHLLAYLLSPLEIHPNVSLPRPSEHSLKILA